MATETIKRNYNMLDAELCMFTSNLCNTLTRDLSDLSVLGLSAPKIAALKALGDAFEVLPPDATFLGDLMIATEGKNALREQIQEIIRTMALRVETKWGAKSGKYSRLNLGAVVRLTDDLLLVTSRDMHTKMAEYLIDLSDLGLTVEMLDDWADLNDQFEAARNSQDDAIQIRDEKTYDRISKGNEIYKLVSTYTSFGKRVYEKTNPPRYNDYIVYDTQVGSISAPTNLTVDVGTMVFSWDAVINATSYVLEATTEVGGSDFEVIYSGPDNFVNYIPTSEGIRNYRIRCRNSGGYSDYSNLMVYNYIAVLAQPGYVSISVINAVTGAIALNWEEVTGASFYRLYQSKVAIGTVPAEYILVGEYTAGAYSGTVATGYRYHFYVISGSSDKLSVASDAVYVDIPLIP